MYKKSSKYIGGKSQVSITRCSWCNLKNPTYIKYHDEEWGKLNLDDHYLYEMLLLECFQAGLSWECILNKRASFRKAFDNFDPIKISKYNEDKITKLLSDKDIIRNRLKIKAAITNANVFLKIKSEFGSFKNYLLTYTNNTVIYETGKTTSALSDIISKDLYKRGMRFVGSITIYSFLQAIGIIYSHEHNCFLYINN